jgi:ATP-binding cassette, subfamily B (MDR/TAP), member 7
MTLNMFSLDGVAKLGSSFLQEARNAVFAQLSQSVIRKVANGIFKHLHSLDISFHLSRQTGALSRILERGTK